MGESGQPRYQDLSRFTVPDGFRGKSAFVVLLWQIVQSTLFGLSPQPMYAWRRFLLRLFGAKVGKSVFVRPTARFTYPWKVALGDFCWIGDNVQVYSLAAIQIGSNSVVSQRTYLCTGTHDISDLLFPLIAKPIVVEEQVWIATDCFVAPGVTIGMATVVLARSVVLKSLPSASIAAGSPATVKRRRELPKTAGGINSRDFR